MAIWSSSERTPTTTKFKRRCMCCGVEAADFVIWFPDGLFVETVAVDHSLVKEFLPRLEKFYFLHYLPAVHAALM